MKLAQRLAIRYYKSKFKLLTSVSKKKAAEKAFDLFCTPMRKSKRKSPSVFKDGEQLSFSLKSNTIRGFRWNAGNERKVLILHGFESSVINFDSYIKPLIKKGYEVLAFDAPAHGLSSGKKITAPEFSESIQYIHEHYGPVQSYMAHSFGGLALSLAMENMEHDENYRLAFIAPATESTTAIDIFLKFLNIESLRDEFEKVLIKKGNQPSSWYSINRALKNIKAQVLWFHDEDDDITPLKDVLKVKEQNFSNIEFTFTKGLGHRKIYRDNDVRKRVIEFL